MNYEHLSVVMEFNMSTLCPNQHDQFLAVGLLPCLLCDVNNAMVPDHA